MRQLEAARRFQEAIWDVWSRAALTLTPITQQRLAEKKARNDHFFATFLLEGLLLASENNPADGLLFAESDLEGLGELAQKELA